MSSPLVIRKALVLTGEIYLEKKNLNSINSAKKINGSLKISLPARKSPLMLHSMP